MQIFQIRQKCENKIELFQCCVYVEFILCNWTMSVWIFLKRMVKIVYEMFLSPIMWIDLLTPYRCGSKIHDSLFALFGMIVKDVSVYVCIIWECCIIFRSLESLRFRDIVFGLSVHCALVSVEKTGEHSCQLTYHPQMSNVVCELSHQISDVHKFTQNS